MPCNPEDGGDPTAGNCAEYAPCRGLRADPTGLLWGEVMHAAADAAQGAAARDAQRKRDARRRRLARQPARVGVDAAAGVERLVRRGQRRRRLHPYPCCLLGDRGA